MIKLKIAPLSNKTWIWIIALVILFFVLSSFSKSAHWIRNITGRLSKHPTKKYNHRSLDQIEEIIIHHSSSSQDTPESIAKYHVGPNHISSEGIPGIAYHFVINRKGTVFQTNKLTTISWHTGNHNTSTIGICLIGNFEVDEPSKAQYKSLVKLIRFLNKKLKLELEISKHKDYRSTDCPGKHFDLEAIIEKL